MGASRGLGLALAKEFADRHWQVVAISWGTSHGLDSLRSSHPDSVIAVMSSELGSITHSSGFWQLYSSSKAALNMLMKSFSAHHTEDSRALMPIAPGWVKTDMGTEDM